MYGIGPIIRGSTNQRSEMLKEWLFAYGEELYQWLAYTTGRRDVESLMIDVFRLASKRIGHFKGDVSPRLWLIALARQQVKHWERKKKPAREMPLDALPLSDAQSERFIDFQQLKPIYKEIFILQCLMEFSSEETAVILNTNSANVDRTFQRLMGYLENLYPNIKASEYGDIIPRPILFDDQIQHIYEALQNEWQRLEDQTKQRKRLRRIINLTIIVGILITAIFFTVTEKGQQMAWNIWAKLNHNIINLEDGVIAQYGDHRITEANFENVERTSAFQDQLATLMVYEEAITMGYEPNEKQVEKELATLREKYQYDAEAQANMFEVMQRANLSAEEYWEHKKQWLTIENVVTQYFIDLFGAPYFPENPLPESSTAYYSQYHEAKNAFKKKMLVAKWGEVLFNKAYDYEFRWREWLEQWKVPSDVIVMHLDVPLVKKNSLELDPEKMDEIDLQKLVGYELLYQEAMRRYLGTGNVEREMEQLRQKYESDPEYQQEVQKTMEQKKLTEEQYWNEMERISIRNSTLARYIGYLYSNISNMNDEMLQKVIDMVALEKFHIMKEQLIFNERHLQRYQWDLELLMQVPQQVRDNLVAIKYKDIHLGFGTGFYFDSSRFDEHSYIVRLLYLIIADMARDFGYMNDDELMQQLNEEWDVMRDNMYERIVLDNIRFQLSDYMRISGITWEEIMEQQRKILESEFVTLFVMESEDEKFYDFRSNILQKTGSNFELDWIKEEYPQYWQYVEFNPNYPFFKSEN